MTASFGFGYTIDGVRDIANRVEDIDGISYLPALLQDRSIILNAISGEPRTTKGAARQGRPQGSTPTSISNLDSLENS